MKKGYKRRGFTLVELVTAAGALALLAVIIMTFTRFGGQALKSGSDSYDIQSGIRVASETAVQQVRYASAVFTIPESTFKKGAAGLTANWNYFGVEQTTNDTGQAVSQIVHYLATADGGHEKTIVAQSPPGTTFDMDFSQNSGEGMDKLIQLDILSYLDGQAAPYMTLETEIDALNALQVVDRYPGIKCTAVAYRTDDRPTAVGERVEVNVIMVLDSSTSMALVVPSNAITLNSEEARTHFLRVSARAMLDMLAAHPSINVACVAYSDKAEPREGSLLDFRNVQEDMAGDNTLKNYFVDYIFGDTSRIDPLYPKGGTNTGDGMRIAHHMLKEQIKKQKEAGVTKTKNYMVIMTDGQAVMATYEGSSPYMVEGDRRVDNCTSTHGNTTAWETNPPDELHLYYDLISDYRLDPNAGIGDPLLINCGIDYAKRWGVKCTELENFSPYIVGLSLDDQGIRGLEALRDAMYCPPEQYHPADSAEALYNAFTSIADTIVTETWHLAGPDI